MATRTFKKPITQMTGATTQTAGVSGLVPTPAAGDDTKYLKGDGSWATLTLPSDMTGASSSAAGTHGLVPAPSLGDQDKYLKGDGTWHAFEVQTFTRQYWSSTSLISITNIATDKAYVVWCAANSAGTLGAMMDSTYGAVIFVNNGEYAIVHKGSAITVSVSSGTLSVSSTSAVKAAIIEL